MSGGASIRPSHGGYPETAREPVPVPVQMDVFEQSGKVAVVLDDAVPLAGRSFGMIPASQAFTLGCQMIALAVKLGGTPSDAKSR